jgi:hypothetical protein
MYFTYNIKVERFCLGAIILPSPYAGCLFCRRAIEALVSKLPAHAAPTGYDMVAFELSCGRRE